MTADGAADPDVTGRTALWVRGWGAELPEHIVSSTEVEQQVTCGYAPVAGAGWLEAATGVQTRRRVADGTAPSDLAVAAGRRALAMAGCAAADIGLLIFAAVSADVFEPAVANIVQAGLGATNATVLDIRAGSNSFLYATHVAGAMAEQGRPVLVTTGEVLSRRVRTTFSDATELERGSAGLAGGDAGAAVLFEVEETGATSVGPPLPFGRFVTQGRHWRSAYVESGGARRGNDLSEDDLKVDLPAFDRWVTDVMPELLRDLVRRCRWGADDFVVVSNLCGDRAARVAELAGFDQVPWLSSVAAFGDTGAAAVPLVLCTAADEGGLPGGQRVALLGAAAGLSGAAVPLVWPAKGS